jgi:hypothetical protein
VFSLCLTVAMIAFSVLRHPRILSANRIMGATIADAVWLRYWTVMLALVGVGAILTSVMLLRVLFVATSSPSESVAAAAAARKGARVGKHVGGGDKKSIPVGYNNINNDDICRAQHELGHRGGGEVSL